MKLLPLTLATLLLLGCSKTEPASPPAVAAAVEAPVATDKMHCRAPSGAEQQELEANRLRIRELSGVSVGIVQASDLDPAWTGWRDSLPDDPEEVERDIEAFGAGLGDEMVRTLGFEWRHCKDAYGEGLMVVALPGRGDVAVYPADFVLKRHERREGAFFSPALVDIAATLEKIRADWNAAGGKADAGAATARASDEPATADEPR